MSITEIAVEKTKLHSAIRAAAYLNKHSHALEDSILRRTIIRDTPSEETVAYCSSCNARTVDKCLQLLSRLSASELQVVVKKTGEILSEDSPKAAVVPSVKQGFKPSLDCKRRPVNTNFSYAKMKKVVFDDMLQKQGKTAERTLRETAFFSAEVSSEVGPTKANKPIENRDRGKCCATVQHKNQENVTKLPDNLGTNSNMPVPKVKLDKNDQIVVDPSSLVLPPRPAEPRGFAQSVKWSLKDTIKFYEALHQHGTDFSLMMSSFPNRERKNLKRKFVFEDKKNRELVDLVIGNNRGTSADLQEVIQQLKTQHDLKMLIQGHR